MKKNNYKNKNKSYFHTPIYDKMSYEEALYTIRTAIKNLTSPDVVFYNVFSKRYFSINFLGIEEKDSIKLDEIQKKSTENLKFLRYYLKYATRLDNINRQEKKEGLFTFFLEFEKNINKKTEKFIKTVKRDLRYKDLSIDDQKKFESYFKIINKNCSELSNMKEKIFDINPTYIEKSDEGFITDSDYNQRVGFIKNEFSPEFMEKHNLNELKQKLEDNRAYIYDWGEEKTEGDISNENDFFDNSLTESGKESFFPLMPSTYEKQFSIFEILIDFISEGI